MKRILILLPFILAANCFVNSQTNPSSKYLKPVNSKVSVSISINGKAKDYYPIREKPSSLIKLSGPGKLMVITRGHFADGKSGKIVYNITYQIDGGRPVILAAKGVSRSIKSSYLNGSGGMPGELKEFEIDLGAGQHAIEFRLLSGEIPVNARYLYTAQKKDVKRDWISISPSLPLHAVELVTNDELSTFYRLSNSSSMKFIIYGPTDLQVITRPEFSFDMKGIVKYRIQVEVDNAVVNTFQLSSKHSDVTTYKSEKQLVAGKGNTIVISVPKGKHSIELVLPDKGDRTVLSRALIPKKNVNPSKMQNE